MGDSTGNPLLQNQYLPLQDLFSFYIFAGIHISYIALYEVRYLITPIHVCLSSHLQRVLDINNKPSKAMYMVVDLEAQPESTMNMTWMEGSLTMGGKNTSKK